MRELEVKERQAYREINTLETVADCRIVHDEYRNGYHYVVPPPTPVLVCLGLDNHLETLTMIHHSLAQHHCLQLTAGRSSRVWESLPVIICNLFGEVVVVAAETPALKFVVFRLRNLVVLSSKPFAGNWNQTELKIGAELELRRKTGSLEQAIVA